MANARMGRRLTEGNVLWPVLSAGKSRLGLVHRIEYGGHQSRPPALFPGHLEICNRDSVSLGNGNRIIHDECLFHLCVFKSSFQFKREHHLGALCGRDDPAGGLKCVDADGNAVDEDPVFHGIPDGRNGIGFPGTRFFHRRSGCRKCSVLVVYGIPIFLYRTDLWNADLFNLI